MQWWVIYRLRKRLDKSKESDSHIKPVDYCLAAEWINADCAEDYYFGDKIALRDGMAVEVEWTGDAWMWTVPKT